MQQDRLSSISNNLSNLYEQLAGEEEALILEEEANKTRIKQKIRKTKERIRDYEQEYTLLLSQKLKKNNLAEPIAEEIVEDLINDFDVLYVSEQRNEIKVLLLQILSELQKPKQPASAKLKLAFPIIPTLVSCQLESDAGSIVRRLFPTFTRVYNGMKSLKSSRQPKATDQSNGEANEEEELSSSIGIDYLELRDLLKDRKWWKADLLTMDLMCKVVDKSANCRFTTSDLEHFPKTDLITIDKLWVKYSQGQFGFSVQKKMYISCGAQLNIEVPKDIYFKRFVDRVGWKLDGWGIDTGMDLPFKLSRGHFPKYLYSRGLFNGISGFTTIFSFNLLKPGEKLAGKALFFTLKNKHLSIN